MADGMGMDGTAFDSQSAVPPYGPGVEMGVALRGRRLALGSKAGPGPDPNMVWTLRVSFVRSVGLGPCFREPV